MAQSRSHKFGQIVGDLLEGFDFVGIEIDKKYFEIAKKRLENMEINHELDFG